MQTTIANRSQAAEKLREALQQTRYRYLFAGGLAVALALLALVQALNAYETTYTLYRGITEVNSTTVDASERALQYIAQASQASADYALLTSDTPLYEQSQNNIFRNFADFRDEMAVLGANLQSDGERTAYSVADTFTYSQFWRHLSNLIAQRSNDAVARREYIDADNHVRTWITPALQELENLNFQQMAEAGSSAQSVILTQLGLFILPALALTVLLTIISFRLRATVRRVLTPGIDGALALTYAVFVLVVLQLIAAPGTLRSMIEDSYLNVSASSRILVDANLANRAESSALLDPARLDVWYARFDDSIETVELRMCGHRDCTAQRFNTIVNRDGGPVISAADSQRIGGITPLVRNLYRSGDADSLETARLALLDYVAVNQRLRGLIELGDTEVAIALNTSMEEGSSQAAFERFADAINAISATNRANFDATWESTQAALTNGRLLLGLLGYAMIAVLLLAGISHRYREL